ncbi:hypothetical protein BDV27DRAFT_130876 [Aspergillus caelatus]|uniref:Uncharacterized protein n=1 Tax=Aspergillus caelatus TaxID=61420 RepID=A0A5N6ZZ40_9EURO|nr:uncharacterized protein BDV27DRAFT_130876 [Aspergillus caelatus]KAE8362874.1 hypothetical protein BDV27DRAFT_130876 [Aspergillus caelatus]
MYCAHFVWSVGSAWQRGTMTLTDRVLVVCLSACPATCHALLSDSSQIDGLADARTRGVYEYEFTSCMYYRLIGYMVMICLEGLTGSKHATQRPGSRNCSEL